MSTSPRRRRVGFAGLVVSNGLPLLGVILLGWNAAALLFLYWLEFGSAVVWALFRALFAGRPSETEDRFLLLGAIGSKYATIPLPLTTVSIRLSSLPIVCLATPILIVLWFFVGALTVGVAGPDSLDPDVGATVVLSAFGIFLSHGATTGISYFGGGEFREHSAQTAINSVFMQLIAIFLGLLFALPFVFEAFGEDIALGTPLLAGVVFVKFAFDVATHYGDRLTAFDKRVGGIFGWIYEPPEAPSIDSLSEIETRERPTRRGLVLGGVTNTLRYVGSLYLGVLCLSLAGFALLANAPTLAIALVIGSVCVPVLIASVDYWIRFASMEYRVAEGAVLGYDFLFRTPQWRVDAWDERGLRIERTRLDRYLGTETVIIELADRDLLLPHLRNVEPILNVFDRQAERLSE